MLESSSSLHDVIEPFSLQLVRMPLWLYFIFTRYHDDSGAGFALSNSMRAPATASWNALKQEWHSSVHALPGNLISQGEDQEERSKRTSTT